MIYLYRRAGCPQPAAYIICMPLRTAAEGSPPYGKRLSSPTPTSSLFRSVSDQNIVLPKGFNASPRNHAVIFGEQPGNAALRGHDKCGNLSATGSNSRSLTSPIRGSVAQIDHLTGQCSSENRMVFCI